MRMLRGIASPITEKDKPQTNQTGHTGKHTRPDLLKHMYNAMDVSTIENLLCQHESISKGMYVHNEGHVTISLILADPHI